MRRRPSTSSASGSTSSSRTSRTCRNSSSPDQRVLPCETSSSQREEQLVDVTIIGTGNMARGVATRALAGELEGDPRAGAVGDPLEGDVVVLAVWYQALDDVIGQYGGQLDGKVV